MTNNSTGIPGWIEEAPVDLANVNTYSFKPSQTAMYSFRMSFESTESIFLVSMFGIDELVDG